MVQLLINHGANVNMVGDRMELSGLNSVYASALVSTDGDTSCLKSLLDAGGIVYFPAVHLSYARKQRQCTKLLLDSGSIWRPNVNIVTISRNTIQLSRIVAVARWAGLVALKEFFQIMF